MQDVPQGDHDLGTTNSLDSDLGFGGTALAVRHEQSGGSELLRIWFAPTCDADPRPESYDDPTASLQASEVASSILYEVSWSPGGGFSTPVARADLHPTTLAQRGAFGAMGLHVAELLPQAGDELVVGTLSGDIIVYSIDPMTSALTEHWRTFVPGSAGCYQGIAVEDLDGDNKQELYVASSSGLYRFTQP